MAFASLWNIIILLLFKKFQVSYLLISFEWSILSFFLSLVSNEAPKPSDSIASMMSRGPVVSVSYTNRPLLVAKATDAWSIPGLLLMLDSIKCTQDEHVIPVIWKQNANKHNLIQINWETIKMQSSLWIKFNWLTRSVQNQSLYCF